MNAVLAIAGADAAERTRRFAFILTIAAALYAGYLYVPAANAAYHTVVIHGHTGIYNSAFYGATIAALTGGFLTLFGFFLVRGAVERDVECHVDAIVGASPVRRRVFVLSKWLSSAAVLWAVSGVSYLAAIAMQVIRAQTLHVDLLAYALPYVLITVPAMAFVAALATAFDVVPFLRGILGGAAFVMLWPAMLTAPIAAGPTVVQPLDPLGFSIISSNLVGAEQRAFHNSGTPDVNFGVIVSSHFGQPFPFTGFQWTGAIVAQRIGWFAAAAFLVLVAALFFDLFRRESVRTRRSVFIDVARLIPNVPFLRIFRAEFGLLANAASVWWYLGAIGIVVAGALVPLESVTKVLLPLALIWPLERISALGARERQYAVQGIVSATAGFAGKTLLLQCLAGALLTLVLCSSCVLRMALAGEALSLLACLAVAVAISAVALALGTMVGASRPFEALFLIVWYLGPIQHVPGFDFGAGMVTAPIGVSLVCAALAAVGIAATASRRSA